MTISSSIARQSLEAISRLPAGFDFCRRSFVVYHCPDLSPEALALGATEFGWRPDAMLRQLYESLDAADREFIDGDEIIFEYVVWQMMTGELVSL